MLEIIGLNKDYIQNKTRIFILKNINITFPNKGLVFILGKSGSGKTTFLNLLGGLDFPTSGEIYFNNTLLIKEKTENYRNYNVGFIFQDFNLLDSLNVYENVALSLQLQNKENKEAILKILEKLEIKHLKLRKIKELSGGEKARVGIARALVKNPYIILADEPTGNLDEITGEKVLKILKEISKEKLVIVVTHDEISAQKYGDYSYYLENGTINNNISKDSLIDSKFPIISHTSKLSLKDILKLSKLLFKKNKWKYFIIFIILIINLTLFTISYFIPQININKTHAETLSLNNKNEITIYKQIKNYTPNANISSFNNAELETITKDLKQNNYQYRVNTSFYSNNAPISFDYVDIYKKELPEIFSLLHSNFNEDKLDFYLTDENILKDYQYIGSFPKNKNEIMISNVLAYFIRNHGIYDDLGNPYFPDSNESFIEDQKAINFNENYFIVTGIYDIKDFDINEFSKKKIEYKETELGKEVIYDEETKKLNQEFGNIFVNNNFFLISDLIPNNEIDKTIYKEYLKINDEFIFLDYNNIASKYTKSELKDNEIIINQDILDLLTNQNFSKSFAQITDLTMQEYANEYIINQSILNQTITLCIRDSYHYKNNEEFKYYNLKIVGIVIDENEYNHKYYLSDNIIKEYALPNNLSKTISIYEEDMIKIEELLKKYPINTSLYRIKTPYSHVIEESLPLISEIKNNSILYILILSIFNIGVFSLFMYILYHFIKKDIGILKCLGAKAKDIYKAQILIDLIIIILTMLVCIPVSIFSVNLINHVISSNLGFTIHYLYFDIKVIFYLSILLITTVFLASILPIRKIINLNPIEVLRKEKI